MSEGGLVAEILQHSKATAVAAVRVNEPLTALLRPHPATRRSALSCIMYFIKHTRVRGVHHLFLAGL